MLIGRSASVASAPGNLRGELLGGKYRLGDVIGAGGMGVVYEATHTELRTRCAVKVVAPERGDPAQFKRLVREARVLAQLSGPHAVRVLDAGRLPEGSPYLVMERLAGEPLSDLLKRTGRLPCDQAILFSSQVCAAVEEAHGRGIIHRDIKPSNVFVLAPDRIKVLDFGLARSFGAPREDSMGTESEFAGSPRYMSPEQIRASPGVTPSSDLWSIAVLLFEMLTGHLPFQGSSSGALLAAIVADPATRLRSLMPEAPPELDRLIADCLEKNPQDRPRDAAEVRARLTALSVVTLERPATPARREALGPDPEVVTVTGEAPAPATRAGMNRSARALAVMVALATLALVVAILERSSFSAAPQAPSRSPSAGEARAPAAPPNTRVPQSALVAQPPHPPSEPNRADHGSAKDVQAAADPVRRPRSVRAPAHAGAASVLEAISTRH
jgi:eukaryotic-like serine/threonine-protein kinase